MLYTHAYAHTHTSCCTYHALLVNQANHLTTVPDLYVYACIVFMRIERRMAVNHLYMYIHAEDAILIYPTQNPVRRRHHQHKEKKSGVVMAIITIIVFRQPKEDEVRVPLLVSNGVPASPPPRVMADCVLLLVDCEGGVVVVVVVVGIIVRVDTAVSVMTSNETVGLEGVDSSVVLLLVLGSSLGLSSELDANLVDELGNRGVGVLPVSVSKPVGPPDNLEAVKVPVPTLRVVVEDKLSTSFDKLRVGVALPPSVVVTVTVTVSG